MGSYGRVEEDLDEYEDDFIDRDDEIGEEYEDGEEGEEEEREDEPLSEEALKLLKYRQKLKEQERARLRRESGGSLSNSRDQIRRPSMNNFGSFFGPSKPVLADRVIQQSRALLETRHLAAKASTSQSQSASQSQSKGKQISAPYTSRTVNGVSHQPSAKQVKSKLQLMKATRDYSFLHTEETDVPKSKSDPGPSGPPRNSSLKPDTRRAQVPAKVNVSAHSASKELNGFQRRRESVTPHMNSARSVPPRKPTAASGNSGFSSDSRRQPELRKQPEASKHVASSSGGSRAVRPPTANIVPPKKPLAATGQKAASGSLMKRPSIGSVNNKGPPPTQNHGQRPPLDKSRTSAGISVERRRDVQQTTGNKMVKKENTLASRNQMKPPRESFHQGNLERDHARNHRPAGKLSTHSHSNAVRKEPVRPCNGLKREPMSHSNGVRNVPVGKKRKAEDFESDKALAELRKMLGSRPSRYDDFSDDDSDMMMETGFHDLMKEESRSARIAKQEDEEELEKIMEEERREALRKKAKMRKMSQR